jgi:hypothetical protein
VSVSLSVGERARWDFQPRARRQVPRFAFGVLLLEHLREIERVHLRRGARALRGPAGLRDDQREIAHLRVEVIRAVGRRDRVNAVDFLSGRISRSRALHDASSSGDQYIRRDNGVDVRIDRLRR